MTATPDIAELRATEWRIIKDATDYEVSDTGLVRRRVTAHCFPAGMVLTPPADRDGYLRVTLLHDDGRKVTHFVHHLVLHAFVGERPEGTQTAHYDGCQTNNNLDNLRWATPVENMADRQRHGHYHRGSKHPMAKLTDEQARAARSDPRSARKVAAELGVAPSTIERIRNGKLWKVSANV